METVAPSAPLYSDLGSLAKNLFSVGYHFGLWKLSCNTKTSNGLEFKTSGHSTQDEGKVFGALQNRYTVTDYGVTLTERWDTDNLLFGSATCRDKVAEGLLLGIEGQMQCGGEGEKKGVIKADYGVKEFRFYADMNIESEPLFNCSVVASIENWLAGYKTAFDTGSKEFKTHCFDIGWSNGETMANVEFIGGLDKYNICLFHQINGQLSAALKVGPESSGGEEGSEMKFGIAAKYLLDEGGEALVRAKVNNDGQIGLGYQQKLRDGVVFLVSGLIEGKDLNGGGHKVGVALEISV